MMRIRRAVLDDRDSFATIRRDAILVLATSAMSQEAATAWAMNTTEERFIRFAEAEAPLGWVEVADDRVNGLYVSPSHARRGVGSILLAHAESSIRAPGYAHIKLRASPNALPFYLRRGYVRVDEPDADGAYALHKALHS
jgi:putative acetyltransferase